MTNLNRVLTAATVAGLAFATASFSVAAADEAEGLLFTTAIWSFRRQARPLQRQMFFLSTSAPDLTSIFIPMILFWWQRASSTSYPSHRKVVFRNYPCKYVDINYDYVHVETWEFYSKYEAPRYSNIAMQTYKFCIDDSYGGYDDNKGTK